MRLPVPFRPRSDEAAPAQVGVRTAPAPTAPVAIARRRRTSELNDPVWRLALSCVALGLVAFVARTLLHPTHALGVVAAAVPALLAWLAAVRLLLLDAKRARLWRVVLLLTGLTVVPGVLGRGVAVAGGIVFLLVRGSRTVQHLTPVRRAKLFFAGLLALSLAMAGYAKLAEPAWPAQLAQNVARTAIDLLRVFWCLTLLRLFFGMRLHFLRLKPKLAISALFLVIVPILLLLAMGTVTLYSVVGGTLAARGRTTVAHWLALMDAEPQMGAILFGPGFHYRVGEPSSANVAPGAPAPAAPGLKTGSAAGAESAAGAGSAAGTGSAAGARSSTAAAPAWAQALPAFVPGLARLLTQGGDTTDASTLSLADTTALVEADSRLWAVRVRGAGREQVELWGHAVDEAVLNRLADILRLDLGIVGGNDVEIGRGSGGQRGLVISMDGEERPADRRAGRSSEPGERAARSARSASSSGDSTAGDEPAGRERGGFRLWGRMTRPSSSADSSRALWDRDLYFGATTLGVLEYDGRRLRSDSALLTVKTTPRRLVGEFTSEDNDFNRAVLILLATLASVFLVLEAFALFFGIRITSTITSATQALYAGTRRLARGDLDTQIDIPNEDEFGDLADSFNEMTTAVRRGREEAVARELLERELGTARRIQERLLPSVMPALPGFEVVAHSEPSRQVGGDYFDFLRLASGRTGVVIADVSGKGIPAAMLMANLQACLQAQAMHPESVAQILARVNNQLARSTDASMFATLFLGDLDAATGELTGACAGHDPPIVCRTDGTIDRLRAGGLILGMLPDMAYEQETLRLMPGDVVVLYTDGITEAMGPPLQPAAAVTAAEAAAAADAAAANGPADGAEPDDSPELTTNFFEEYRLLEVVRAHRHRPAAQIRDAILRAVADHTAGIRQSDDITLIVMKRIAAA